MKCQDKYFNERKRLIRKFNYLNCNTKRFRQNVWFSRYLVIVCIEIYVYRLDESVPFVLL